MSEIKILIVDDHEVVRSGLSFLFKQYDHFKVVGEAENVTDSLKMVEELHPDVVIMDVRLRDGSGIDACEKITSQFLDVNVIMLTSFGDDEIVLESIRAGAKGFVLKDVGNDELIKAIEAASRGESQLDPMITSKLLDHLRRSPQGSKDETAKLTKQEKKVLAFVAEGMTNRQIAGKIFLSEKTVRNYVSNILSKLNLNNRAEAAAYAIKNKMNSESELNK